MNSNTFEFLLWLLEIYLCCEEFDHNLALDGAANFSYEKNKKIFET